MEAIITNALIRCTRADDLAQESFELVRKDMGLWVMELPEDFQEIVAILDSNHSLLKRLSVGSSDYVLHLKLILDDMRSILIPPKLALIAGACGFGIEVYREETRF